MRPAARQIFRQHPDSEHVVVVCAKAVRSLAVAWQRAEIALAARPMAGPANRRQRNICSQAGKWRLWRKRAVCARWHEPVANKKPSDARKKPRAVVVSAARGAVKSHAGVGEPNSPTGVDDAVTSTPPHNVR
jgi:hypothetical protein